MRNTISLSVDIRPTEAIGMMEEGESPSWSKTLSSVPKVLIKPAARVVSLHGPSASRVKIATEFTALSPRPLGRRSILGGGFAVDFGSDDDVTHFLELDLLAGLPIKVIRAATAPKPIGTASPPWVDSRPNICFDTDWLDGPKASFSPERLLALTKSKLNSLSPDRVVYCDGSRTSDPARCGLGVVWPTLGITINYRLPDVLSIASVELYAILFSLQGSPTSNSLLLSRRIGTALMWSPFTSQEKMPALLTAIGR